MTRRWYTLAVAAATMCVLGVLAPIVLERHSLNSIDTAIKLIQATELNRSSFRSMALSYPAHDLDPDEQFLPFASPFVFMSAGRWQSVFSSFFAVIIAPLLRHGIDWIVGLSMLSIAAAMAATSRLPGSGAVAALLALLATPIWLYGLNPTEMPLALAAAMSAFAVGAAVEGRRGDWTAGVLLGIAVLLRDEMLLLGPGLLYARTLAGSHPRQWWRALAGVAVPLVVMAAIDQWWFQRPMFAHLRHAVPGFDAMLPRARAILPALETMSWSTRLETIVAYWFFGFSGLAAAGLAALLVLAHAVGRRTLWPVAALVVIVTTMHLGDLAELVAAPRLMAGLFRLAPFLVLALLPQPGEGPPAPGVRLAWVTSACYLAVVAVTLNTEGGKPAGPRLVISLWPLLSVAAILTWHRYAALARSSWPARVTALAGLVLIAGSLTMEMNVVRRARAARNVEDAEAARLVQSIGDRVIVLETIFEIDLAGPMYFERAVMLATPRQRRQLSAHLAAAGIDRFTYVGKPPIDHPPNYREYRLGEEWRPGQYLIQRWMRDSSGGP